MKRSTWITLAVFALLVAVWFGQTRPKTHDAPPPLSIDGYIGNVGIEEARTLGQKQPAPYTHIALSRLDAKDGKETIELDKVATLAVEPAKSDDKAPPPEAKWQAKRTVNGKSTTWKAQGFRATSMVEQLQRSIRSNFAVRVDAKSAAEYGLDPEHAIDIELSGGGGPAVKLRVGLLQKAEKDGEATTWIADPAHPDVAFQLAGRDLRTAFDFHWNDLRDRQLLTLDVTAIDRLELVRPGQKPARVVITRAAQNGDKPQEVAQAWTIAEPAGVRVGDVDEWLKAIERLSAAEFVAADDGAAKSSGLDSPDAPILTISNGSQKTVLIFGNTDDTRPNKESWLRVVGRDETYRIGSYQRDQVLLSLDQLRDRHLLSGMSAKDLQSFAISGPSSRFAAERRDGEWHALSLKESADSNKLNTFVAFMDGLKVDLLPEAPTASALDTPEWTIQLKFADANQLISLSKEESGSVYGKWLTGQGEVRVFKLTNWNAKQLEKQPSDFQANSQNGAAPPAAGAPMPGAPSNER